MPARPRRMGRPTLEAASAMKERLLECALRMLCLTGSNGLAMDALAEEASVTKRTIYRHFDGKDALIDAVVDRELVRLESGMVPAEDLPSDPLARLEAWSGHFFIYTLDASVRQISMFLGFEQLNDPGLALRLQNWTGRAIAPAIDLILEAQEHRQIRSGNPRLLAVLLMDLLQGASNRMNFNFPPQDVKGGLSDQDFFASRWAAFVQLTACDPWADALSSGR